MRPGQEATPDELRREVRELREDLTFLRLARPLPTIADELTAPQRAAIDQLLQAVA